MTLAADTPPEQLERLRAALQACATIRPAHDAVTPDAPAVAQEAGEGVGVAALGAAWAAEAAEAAEGGQQPGQASSRQQLQQQQVEEHEWVTRSNRVADAVTWGAGAMASGIRTWGLMVESSLQSGSKVIVQNTAPAQQPVQVSWLYVRRPTVASVSRRGGEEEVEGRRVAVVEPAANVLRGVGGLAEQTRR